MTAEQVELFHVDPIVPLPADPMEKLSPDRRRTLRQKALVEQGIHPLMGGRARPELGNCGTCAHRVHLSNFQQPKCDVGPTTKSARTDVRRWWPACGLWTAA